MAFAIHALAEADDTQEIDCAGFQHAGANPLQDRRNSASSAVSRAGVVATMAFVGIPVRQFLGNPQRYACR